MNFIEHLKQKRILKLRKKALEPKWKSIVYELQLFNRVGDYPKEVKVNFMENGLKLNFDIAGICSYSKVEKNLEFIGNLFGAEEITASNKGGNITLTIFDKELENLDYKKYILPPTKLLAGYNYQDFITIDMSKVPHLLISGLSGQGKSRMINYMLNNLIGADVVVLNGYKEDYKGVKVINNLNEIEAYLKSILVDENERDRPLYVVIEEMQRFSNDKVISSLCKDLLSYGRHKNIFVIGCIQIATKENCKFKDLFNSRLTFKQIDNSAYSVCLGVGVDKDLQKQEFFLYAQDGLIKGRTFNNEF